MSRRANRFRGALDDVARGARDSSSRQSHASGADARVARAVVLLRRAPGEADVRIRAGRRGQAGRVCPFLCACSSPHGHARRARARRAQPAAPSFDRSRVWHWRGGIRVGARVRAFLNAGWRRSASVGGSRSELDVSASRASRTGGRRRRCEADRHTRIGHRHRARVRRERASARQAPVCCWITSGTGFGAAQAVLVVEPIARSVTGWWTEWTTALGDDGVRTDEWRFPATLPALLSDIASGAGLNPRELTARTIYVPRAASDSVIGIRRPQDCQNPAG